MVLVLPWILLMEVSQRDNSMNKQATTPINTQVDTRTIKQNYHSLGRRIVAQFCIFTLVLSTVYSFFSFMLMYNLEDTFIEQEVLKEARYLAEHYRNAQAWPSPKNEYMALYTAPHYLPDEIKATLIEQPKRGEFYGTDGRHYHIYPMERLNISTDAYLVAEVSEMLVVRPIRDGVIKIMIIFGVLLSVIAFLIAWHLGRKTAKPLQQLANLVDGVAPEDIPDKFVHHFPNNEIGILANTLEHSFERTKQALTREKSFTRDVSHELRTPVAIIKNAVEVHNSNQESDPAQIIERIAQASMQMEQTVTTLLALAREESALTDKAPTALLPLVEQSIINHSHLLNNKNVDVKVSEQCEQTLLVQAGMLKILLDNLVSNAFQYTLSGTVEINFIDGQLIISDTGPGIEENILSHVTQASVKGSQSTGYGFGLSIVKRLCEHQGWQLTVESNKGTSVSIKF